MSSTIMNFLRTVRDFLWKVRDLTFPLILNGKRPKRSIVRYIGSVLPLPSAPKVYLHLPAWQIYHDGMDRIRRPSDQQSLDNDDSGNGNETLSEWSDAACIHDATIQQLQDDLKALREQVASILSKQSDASSKVETVRCTAPAAPPPPPPPPPPLPPPVLVSADTQVTPMRPITRKPLAQRNDQVDPLSEVLKEMKNGRPKLKPIQRSPGGRPVKPPKIFSDPADILTEVLKKRFLAANFSDTNESDTSSCTEVVSPDTTTLFI